jgi:hypothetical protein
MDRHRAGPSSNCLTEFIFLPPSTWLCWPQVRPDPASVTLPSSLPRGKSLSGREGLWLSSSAPSGRALPPWFLAIVPAPRDLELRDRIRGDSDSLTP